MESEQQEKYKILNEPALTAAYEILGKKVKKMEEIDTTNQLPNKQNLSLQLTNLIGSVNYKAEAIRLNKLWVGSSSYPVNLPNLPQFLNRVIFV